MHNFMLHVSLRVTINQCSGVLVKMQAFGILNVTIIDEVKNPV